LAKEGKASLFSVSARRNTLEVLAVLALLALLVIYTVRPNWDIDIYWHIKTGEWIEQHKEIPKTDIFSATDQNRPWVPFQWLYELLTYEIDARLGFFYVRLLHAILFIFGFALFYVYLRKLKLGRVFAFFFFLLALSLTEDRLRIRPEAFNFFFFVLMLPEVIGQRKNLFLVVLVSMLWANIHAGGAILLPVCFGTVLFAKLLQKVSGQHLPLKDDLKKFVFSSVAMLLMPYFVSGVKTAFTMLEESAVLIPEWHPPLAYFVPELSGSLTAHHVLCGAFPYLYLFLLAFIYIFYLAKQGLFCALKHKHLGLLLLALALATLSVKSARFIYLSAFSLFLLVYSIRDWIRKQVEPFGRRLALILLSFALLGISYENIIIKQRKGLTSALATMLVDHEPDLFPEKASDALQAMGIKGKIFHYTQWGGYLLYRLFPDCTVFTDGRGNFTKEEKEALIETHRPYEREKALEEAFKKFDFDIVMFRPPVFPLYYWEKDRWLLIYRDDVAEVFLRLKDKNKENVRRVLEYYGKRGIDVSRGALVFQEEFLRVLRVEYLQKPKVRHKLLSAINRIKSAENPREAATGYYDYSMIMFSAGDYENAKKGLERILALGFPSSTVLLYIAWCDFLLGDKDGARAKLSELLSLKQKGIRDFAPLGWAGKKILGLLASRVGIETMEE
jgi:hypothetical protein